MLDYNSHACKMTTHWQYQEFSILVLKYRHEGYHGILLIPVNNEEGIQFC